MLISAALFTACTTAPFDISDYFPKPEVKALPPAPTVNTYPEAQISEPLTSAPAPEDSTYGKGILIDICLLYTSPSPRDATLSRMPSSA